MGKEKFDVLIIGAGPAGASALEQLSAFLSIAVIDSGDKLSPQDKAKLCGGLLTSRAQILLGEIPQEVRVKPYKTKIEYHDLDTGIYLRYPVSYANCQRGLLDKWLLERALSQKARTSLYLPNTTVNTISKDDGNWLVSARSVREGTLRSFVVRYVIDASGWRQVMRRLLKKALAPYLNAVQVKFALKSPPYPYYIAMFERNKTPFFAWWIPKTVESIDSPKSLSSPCSEFHFAELGAGFPMNAKHNLDESLKGFLTHLASRGVETGEKIEVRGCPLAHIRKMTDVWLGEDNVFVCGEAAGLVSPSSGDGISYAIASGRACARAINATLKIRSSTSKATVNAHRLYRKLIWTELAELRLNIEKAKILASPSGRTIASAVYRMVRPWKIERL